MRILVGTLYTIENEFEECCAAVRVQTHQDFEHLVIRNLPNKEAHATLYSTFVGRRNEFQLLVKVDADMVVENRGLLAGVVTAFTGQPTLEHLQISVHDWFTDRQVMGMNCYRHTVSWNLGDEL